MSQKILVPLDGSTGSEAVLPTARDLAALRGATLRLLHVAPAAEPIVTDGRVVAYADQETSRLAHQSLSYLQRVATGFPELGVELAVRFGDPAREIAEEAEVAGVDLIAMATHPWSRVTRLVRASVTSEVERRSHVPVLVVQYGSPVLV